ncbi:DNA-binding protein [Knoellia sinensis KCTC 19936]|uniref:DNA-binding protein n=1 Tax=Knoellia sinensis KCTC 19936 TaxID=1385520 RepID=A0A0A0JDG2_9MICO|nr:type II toxin-antitoxin system VapC family toxin [Knoellia sinensis]KGN34854.1 DNA-binding protein [Knoellia sinensis KCTC 19936]
MATERDSSSTLVDSNVLLDLFTDDPRWAGWSAGALSDAADRGPLIINPIIYAEVSVRFTRIEELEDALPARDFTREPLPWEAGFLAGKAYSAYRSRGGAKRSTLPDFYIGAHAAVSGHSLLTRDAARFSTYFPTIAITSPPA